VLELTTVWPTIAIPFRNNNQMAFPNPAGPDNEPGFAGIDDDNYGGGGNDPNEYGWIYSDDDTDIHATNALDYQLELIPSQTTSEQPMLLPKGIVIDLDNSVIPPGWLTGNSAPYSPSNPKYIVNMDLLFSPRGTVTGNAAARGMIHLLLADTKDTDQAATVTLTQRVGDQLLLTLFTRTGNVSTYPVDLTTNGDPYSYAKSGSIAGK
jgi:hypothetical protein